MRRSGSGETRYFEEDTEASRGVPNSRLISRSKRQALGGLSHEKGADFSSSGSGTRISRCARRELPSEPPGGCCGEGRIRDGPECSSRGQSASPEPKRCGAMARGLYAASNSGGLLSVRQESGLVGLSPAAPRLQELTSRGRTSNFWMPRCQGFRERPSCL
jgi:hypothetical protein